MNKIEAETVATKVWGFSGLDDEETMGDEHWDKNDFVHWLLSLDS